MINEEDKKIIDKMSYVDMLHLWRFAPADHPYFQGKVGIYFERIMKKKRKEIGNTEHARISKIIGRKNN